MGDTHGQDGHADTREKLFLFSSSFATAFRAQLTPRTTPTSISSSEAGRSPATS